MCSGNSHSIGHASVNLLWGDCRQRVAVLQLYTNSQTRHLNWLNSQGLFRYVALDSSLDAHLRSYKWGWILDAFAPSSTAVAQRQFSKTAQAPACTLLSLLFWVETAARLVLEASFSKNSRSARSQSVNLFLQFARPRSFEIGLQYSQR